jgi:asparagine synthase (glutamine-hydrolysing)
MCGFAGFLGAGQIPADSWSSLLEIMGCAIEHRGPDDAGSWSDVDSGIGIVHRRLSILDLSSAGHQPMVSVSGRFVIAFNGEIYNHLDLREELERVGAGSTAVGKWRGHSDTETLLAGIERWGVKLALKKAVGMFAFALWDREANRLFLARDRIGEKPLYYGWQQGTFLFGSELKSLRVHPSFKGEIDRGAITLFMRHSYIPAPYTIYRSIHKLTPGCLLEVKLGCNQILGQPEPYWSIADAIAVGRATPFAGNEREATDALEELLRHAVRGQMMSDVPLGAFLSGGVDSTTVVALMQAQSERPVKTFTIGFNEESYNEAAHAKGVARHLGTEHTELYVTPEQALRVIPNLPSLYDEPFSDTSQIPTFLLSELTRQHVTVSLSGDGGDELFGGYDRYSNASRWRSRIPSHFSSLKKIVGHAAKLGGVFDARRSELWDLLRELLISETNAEFYLPRVSHWKRPDLLVVDGYEPLTAFTDTRRALHTSDFLQDMMALDTVTYLPDEILVKVDRAAMGVSLETRIPMLDHRVVEFAWRLPLSMKVQGGQGKWILRQVLNRYVPKELIERPKMGFGVPIDSWLRGPLREWADALIDEARLRHEGFFNPALIRQKWDEHLSGTRNWQYHLWDVLMFQAWLEKERGL